MSYCVPERLQVTAVPVKMFAFLVGSITMEIFVKGSAQLNVRRPQSNAHKPHLMDVLSLLYVTQKQPTLTENSVSNNNVHLSAKNTNSNVAEILTN